MDGRRRQWIAWDVFFNNGSLGSGIRERFGVCGMTVFQSFLSACKKSSVQGQMSYASDTEAFAVMGLPGLELVNEKGEEWSLDEFWTYLGQQKQIRRRRRGRITDVVSTRWGQWQNTPGRPKGDTRKPTSSQGNADELEPDTADDNDIDPDIDPDPDSESDSDPDSASSGANVSDEGGEGKVGGLIRMLAAACTANSRKRVGVEAMLVIGLCKPHAPYEVLEAAVMATIRAKEPPVLPRAAIKSFQRECRRRGLPAPLVDESMVADAGKRAS